AVPYGSVTTYQEIAERIGRPQAPRAVANALAPAIPPMAGRTGQVGVGRAGSGGRVRQAGQAGGVRRSTPAVPRRT
ncbi:MGMT family protein, partial [Microbispora sp. NPDC046933]|uniref:MGMT family protein n=1 Tax=Microbispora sp. NPDC046933 TaxID=3155618 RepID=UPI0033DB6842